MLPGQEWARKASAAIAHQILTNGGKSDEDRFRYAALLVLQRPPTRQEQAQVVKYIDDLRKQYTRDTELPRRMARFGVKFPGDLVEAAIWTDLTWVLINMTEFSFPR